METPPRFKVGDTIYWYCDKEQRIHQAKVEFVNYVHIGKFYDDINYEVEVECCGEKKTMFIDEDDVMQNDVWVLTEADRIDEKYLFTLQQGISKNQLKEMHDSHLTLVVPQDYIKSFPKEYQGEISNLSGFIRMVKEKQESLPRHYLLS